MDPEPHSHDHPHRKLRDLVHRRKSSDKHAAHSSSPSTNIAHEPARTAQPKDCDIFIQASDFVHNVDKHEISGPVSAKPMGPIDITANDWIVTGSPTKKELSTVKKHIKETNSVMSKRVVIASEASKDE